MPSRRCPHCRTVSAYNRGGEKNKFGSPTRRIRFDRCQNDECLSFLAVVFDENDEEVETLPTLEDEPDEGLPPDVEIAFRQVLRSLNERIWDGCVVMCRRALEEATNALGKEIEDEKERKKFEKMVLYDRIGFLADAHMITPELSEWAHEGRMGGKLGAHGGEKKKWNSERDAVEIVEFARWFFRYVFILPEQLRRRREDTQKAPDVMPQGEHTDEDAQETLERDSEAQ